MYKLGQDLAPFARQGEQAHGSHNGHKAEKGSQQHPLPMPAQ